LVFFDTHKRLCERIFEKFKAPSMFLSKDAVLACYACGKTSGLVVDIGASGTVVTPVLDGWAEVNALNRTPVGGRYMDAHVMSLLRASRAGGEGGGGGGDGGGGGGIVGPLPLFRLSKTVDSDRAVHVQVNSSIQNVHPSYDALMNLEMCRNIKESVCRISDGALHDLIKKKTKVPPLPYELPDGTLVDLGMDRYHVAELLCDPTSLDLDAPEMVSLGIHSARVGALPFRLKGLPRLCSDAVLRCHADSQNTLLSNVIMVGGGSAMHGVPERIRHELQLIVEAAAPGWKVKSISPTANERALSAWLGGSILASLSAFSDMWMTRKEYDDGGAQYIEKKCP